MIANYLGRVVRHETYARRDGSEGVNIICTPVPGDGEWDDSIGVDPEHGLPSVGSTVAVRTLIRSRISRAGKPYLTLWALAWEVADAGPAAAAPADAARV